MKRLGLLAFSVTLAGCQCLGFHKSAPGHEARLGDQAALATRLAGLQETGQNDVFCGEGAARQQLDARFFGDNQDMLRITVPAISPEALVLDCGWSRAGPVCEAGTLRIMFHQFGDGTTIGESATAFEQKCDQVKIS